MSRLAASACLSLWCGVAALGGAQPAAPPPRLAWQWDAAPLLTDAGARAAMLAFLARERIATLWIQVETAPLPPGAARPPLPAGDTHGTPRQLTRPEGWRTLIADAHRLGLRVEALDGDPSWAAPSLHHAPLTVLDAVLAYNRSAEPGERFDGVHFDIEPYVLAGWRNGRIREQLLAGLVDVATHCQRHAREPGGLRFGVDIPYWWDVADDRTGRPIGDVAFQGRRQSAARHLIERLDNVGVMNYRNTAAGPDGMIANGTPILEYADTVRGATVYMGVETSRSDPRDTWFLVGRPAAEIDQLLEEPSVGIAADGRFRGFPVRVWDDGRRAHVGLAVPAGMGAEPTPAFRDALVALGRRAAGAAAGRSAPDVERDRDRALWSVTRDPEHRDPRAVVVRDGERGVDYLGFVASYIMLPKLTFHGLPAATLTRELAAAETAFTRHRSFGGLAIHHAASLRAIVGAY